MVSVLTLKRLSRDWLFSRAEKDHCQQAYQTYLRIRGSAAVGA